MKKTILLIIALFLLTGCSAKYNASINEDLSIIEEAKLTGTESFFANFYKTTKKHVLEDFIDIYKNILDEKKYQYEIVTDKTKTPYVLVNKKYNTINEYIDNSMLFNGYFDKIKYTENGNIKKIETVGYHENDINDPERFDVKELEISITCAYKVKNHNAKEVNKKTNTYYYELNKKNGYKILLEFDASKKFNPSDEILNTILICLGIIVLAWLLILILNKRKKIKN